LGFVSYLWGIETSVLKRLSKWAGSLYLTFEGLKHLFDERGVGSPLFVCILPLRDWNIFSPESTDPKFHVCILPLRDWNSRVLSIFWSRTIVCILPLRDWNFGGAGFGNRNAWSLYLTFEGLKLVVQTAQQMINHACLYLTFEGLKLCRAVALHPERFAVCILPLRDWNNLDGMQYLNDLYEGLYLTFEGLKLHMVISPITTMPRFVSYLWGIETRSKSHRWPIISCLYLTFEGLKHKTVMVFPLTGVLVCILPLRDWNYWYINFIISVVLFSLYLTFEGLKLPSRSPENRRYQWEFVSYLWGIETSTLPESSNTVCSFVSYLWGIETRH